MTFDNVSFAYPLRPDATVLSGLSLDVEPGKVGVARMVAVAAGDADLIDFGARPRQVHEPEVMRATVTRLRDEVGFVPKWSLGDGIADAVARRLAKPA